MLTFHTRDVPELTIEEESDGTLSSFRANGRRASASPLSVRPVRQPPKATTDAIKRIFTHHTPPPKLTDAEYVNAIKDILFFKCHAIICRKYVIVSTTQRGSFCSCAHARSRGRVARSCWILMPSESSGAVLDRGCRVCGSTTAPTSE